MYIYLNIYIYIHTLTYIRYICIVYSNIIYTHVASGIYELDGLTEVESKLGLCM